MFKQIFFTLLLFGCMPQEQLDVKYRKAFEYIETTDTIKYVLCDSLQKSKTFQISIYDSIVPMEISSFFEHIAKENHVKDSENMVILLDSLITMDKKRWFQPIFVDGLSKLSDDRKSEFILFFSKPFNNTLLAELFPTYGSQRNYEDIRRFNKSVLYLFYFGPDNRIEKVLVTCPLYD